MKWQDRIGRRLKTRDLHVFLAVAEQGNMAKAAEWLSISRPVVSKVVADLESTLGVKLLDRTPKGVEPTAFGRALIDRSRSVFDELRRGVIEIEALSDPGSGEVRIGCTEAIAAGFLSAAFAKMVARYPRVILHMELGHASNLHDMLRARRCELAIGRPLMDAPQADIESTALFHERLKIVVGAANRWARKRKVLLADLIDEPWIQAAHEVEAGGPTAQAFATAGLPLPRIRIYSPSLNLRYSLLANGNYLTMMPESVLRFAPDRTAIKVLPITLPRWRFPTSVSTLKHRSLTPSALTFVECVRETVRPLQRDDV